MMRVMYISYYDDSGVDKSHDENSVDKQISSMMRVVQNLSLMRVAQISLYDESSVDQFYDETGVELCHMIELRCRLIESVVDYFHMM